MPAEVFPSVRILRSSASVLRTTSERDMRSGPRSPPRASSPWHDAHAVSKAALASMRLTAFVLDAVLPGLFCALRETAAIARKQDTAVNRIKTSAETDRFLRSLGMADLKQFGLRDQLFRKQRNRLLRMLPKMLKCARLKRSEERRVGKGVDLGRCRSIKNKIERRK